MKKSLLLLASLLVSVASFAQWAKPVPKAAASVEYSTFAEEGGDTIVYYLYNRDAKAFFTEGNAWGTQASISETGLKVAITKYIPTDEEGQEWDGKTVFINDYSLAKKAWKKLFIDSETQSFVDLGNQTNYFWELEALGGGDYYVKGAEVNPTYNAGFLFGMDSNTLEAGGTTIAPYIDPAEDLGAQVVWQFITEAEYEAYQAVLPTYTTAVKLGNAIETAQTYGINTAAAEAVYNNTSSTIEELTAAYDTLNDAIKKAEFGDATEDNPKDCTSWLVNPDFSAGNASGWDCTFEAGKNATNIGYQSASYSNGDVKISAFIEAWTPNALNEYIPGVNAIGVGQLSQTIKNMPQGKYMLTVDCIAVAQNVAENNPVKGVQLFATGGDVDIYTELATGNGKPEHFELVFVNAGDDITMGLRTTKDCVANWIAADNFTLTYYGPTAEDPAKIAMDEIVKAALALYPLEDLDEVAANKDVKDAYKQAIEDAQSATEDYTTKGQTVKDAQAALKNSMAAYNAYLEQVQAISSYLETHDLTSDEAAELADYVMDGNEMEPDETYPLGSVFYILSNMTATDAEITAEATRIKELMELAISNSLSEGDDCTDFIVNPDFSDANGKGWTKAKGSPVMHGGLQSFPCAELWHAVFDIYQDIKVPDGIYSLSLNGFCRLDASQEEVPAYIYMNDFATRLMNIREESQIISYADAVDGVNCYLTNGETSVTLTSESSKFYGDPYNGTNDFSDTDTGEGYVPNSMQGASVAFSADRYKATVYGLVEGGKMRIGVRNLTDNQVWALWSNFKLTYVGKNEEALLAILPTYMDQLEQYLDTHADKLTEPEQEAIAAALKAAEDADDADEMYEALKGLNSEYTSAGENVAAVEELLTAIEDLTTALEISTNNEAINAYNQIQDKLDNYSQLNTEGVTALTGDVKELAAWLAVPDGTGATDDEPADFTSIIKNPDFEANTAGQQATGWTLVKGETASGNYQTQNGYDGGVSMEFWSPTQGEGTQYDFYQRISHLPAGTYTISCEASNSLNGMEAGEGEGAAYLYAAAAKGDEVRQVLSAPFAVQEEGCTAARNPYEVTIKIAEGEDLIVGSKNIGQLSARWVMIDNFTVNYYGPNSTKEESPEDTTDITSVSPVITSVAIYNVSGARINTLQKGLNIVKMSNGSVQKIIVK